jgi:NADH-quinone oxidoreductase subunit M
VGVLLPVIYILTMVQKSMFGEAEEERRVWDVEFREILILVVLAVAVLFIGLHPGPILRLFENSLGYLMFQAPMLARALGG